MSEAKALLAPLFHEMVDFDSYRVLSQLQSLMHEQATVHMCHPFGDLTGSNEYFSQCYEPLLKAMPDIERRDLITVSGLTESDQNWVGCLGHYVGSFLNPWLDIPPTGHLTHMRFHEFYRIEDHKIVEIQAIWDIPEVMMQANAWPLAPSLGWEGFIPGPASQDGLNISNDFPDQGQQSVALIYHMLEHMTRHPKMGGPEVMQLERFWHPKMNWYGPAGIGTARGIAGFRHWHQIPFLNAMPDRAPVDEALDIHFFGEGQYASVTGWPNMQQTISHDGWLGIAPRGQKVNLRSLDFWRIDKNLIRENWVLVDLLDVYRQLGVDVFARLKEFNKARNMAYLNTSLGNT